MATVTRLPAAWAGSAFRPMLPPSPLVAVLAGVDASGIVDKALDDPALTEMALLRFEPACSPPCDAVLWRMETAAGDALNERGVLHRHWHRRPYAMTLRLVQYRPGCTVPQILDEGTLGTRGPYAAFKAAADRLAMRFVRDAALGKARGPAGSVAAAPPFGLPGWADAWRERWRDRLKAEWWSVGSTTVPMDRVFAGGGLGPVTWYRTAMGQRYLADPFAWPGTGRILCEEMPLAGGAGRIVSVAMDRGEAVPDAVLLDDGWHHSYPCTLRVGSVVYCVPEATQRGGTCIYRLDDGGQLAPISEVAPHARLADPTLFRSGGRFWLGCTDLDLGEHDNLCLMHAPEIAGPWTPHARWPVKIDVRGARPAGMVFSVDGRLFRPAQDCAATYGAAVAIHEIAVLTGSDYRESLVCVLRPDPNGPFPDGLHTLAHDGVRFWVDGKRFVFSPGSLRRKLVDRASGMLSRMGVG